MCVIIDTNKAADFCRQDRPYLKILMHWISKGGRVASGGDLEKELYKIEKMRAIISEWSRSGRLVRYSAEKISAVEVGIENLCRSNDSHVVALAIVSQASIVVTEDKLLIDDLREKSIVGVKRRIYKENSASPAKTDHLRRLLSRSNCP